MTPKTACLFFGIIFIALQFCHVSCRTASIDLKVNPKTKSETYSNYLTLKIEKTASTPTNGSSSKEPTAVPIALRPIISSNKVHVKRGDNFKIGCQVKETIDNCFLQSPNGTMFAVAYGDIVPNDPSIITGSYCNVMGAYRTMSEEFACVKYLESQKNKKSLESFIKTLTPAVDSDFPLGVCFAVIENSDDSHNGNWRCQLDLRYTQEEIETIVPVTVEESYLLTSVEIVPQTTKTIIKCTAIPSLPSKIINCRWTFPNGAGIYKKNVPNIEVSHTDTSCVLKFNGWNNEYRGKWSCFAEFENKFGQKFHTSKFISI